MHDHNQSQRGINAGTGDVSGRDTIKTINNFLPSESSDHCSLLSVYQDLLNKITGGSTASDLDIEDQLDDLKHYSGNIRPERNLENKLIESNRKYLVNSALRYKNKAARLIAKHQDSPACEYLLATILVRLERDFNHIIQPMIENHSSVEEIDATIINSVINPIQKILKGTPLEIRYDCVTELFYFLAGNCHISWDKQC